MATTTTEIPSSTRLLGELTGPELAYTHTGTAVILSIYKLTQNTDKGLYLVQWLSSEIKLRYKAVLGETIYLTKCFQMQGTVEHHQTDPKPNNRLQLEPTWIGCKDQTNDVIIQWGSVIGIGHSHDFGWYVQGWRMDRWTS